MAWSRTASSGHLTGPLPLYTPKDMTLPREGSAGMRAPPDDPTTEIDQ